MLETTSKLALIMMLATAPMAAFAQSTDTAADEEIATDADIAQTDVEPLVEGAEGDADVAADTGMAPTDGEIIENAEAEPAPEPIQGQIVMQSENSILANDLIGLSVFTTQDENVGDINDIIITLDGSVEGVVVGVGGFLGMGEKNVAIDMSELDVIEGEQGLLRMTLAATEADLEAAEEFVSRQQQTRELEAETLNTAAPTTDEPVVEPVENTDAN